MGLQDERLLITDTRQQTAAAPPAPVPEASDSSSNNNSTTVNTNTTNNGVAAGQQQHTHPSPAPASLSQPAPPPPAPVAPIGGGEFRPHPSGAVVAGQASPSPAFQHEYSSPQENNGAHGDDLGPPRKRRRPALSCEPCRRRKVRCDRTHPCGPCVRMGVNSACEYDNRFPRPGLPPGANEFPAHPANPVYRRQSDDHYHSVPGGYEEFEAQVRNHAAPTPLSRLSAATANGATSTNGTIYATPPHSNGHAAHAAVVPQRDTRDLQNRLAKVEQLVAAQNNGPTAGHSTDLEEHVRALTSRIEWLERRVLTSNHDGSEPQDHSGLAVPIASPRIKVPILGENTTKFWGPTHYMHLFDPKSDLFGRMLSSNPKFNITQVLPNSSTVAQFQHCRNLRQAIKERSRVKRADSLAEVLQTLPLLPLRDQLVDHYFRTFEEVYGVFHAPTFQQRYGQHREDLGRASEATLVQILLVFAIGAVFVAEPNRTSLRPLVCRWVYSAQAWLTGPLEKSHGGDEWLRCWCLLILARQVNSVGTKEQTYTLAGSMVRSAFTIGVHRDAKQFAGLSPFRVEMRRRLWSAILELSLSTSSDASMPPIVKPDEYDSMSPIGVPDDRMDEQSGGLDGHHEPTESIHSLLRQSYAIRYKVHAMLNDFHNVMIYDKVLNMTADLDSALAQISSFFSKIWQSRTATSTTDFHHKLLAYFVHGTQLDLHTAFLAAAKKDQRFHFSRHKALESAMALLASLGNLDHHSATLDDISKLTLVGTGVFKNGLSMKAIAVVCQELNLQLAEAQNSFSTTSREPLFRTLRHVQEQSLHLVKSGDPSCKRYAYLKVTIPMIEARQGGHSAEEVIPQALSECLRVCCDVMTSQLSPEQVPPNSNASVPDGPSDGKSSVDLASFENMDFTFDPSWLLTAWHFGNGMA